MDGTVAEIPKCLYDFAYIHDRDGRLYSFRVMVIHC